MRTSPQSSPDIKPTIDEIVHDTFTLQARSTSPPTSPRPSINSSKIPSFVIRGQRPRPHVTVSYFQSLDGALIESGGVETTHLVGRLRSSHDAVLTDHLDYPNKNGERPSNPKIILFNEDLKDSNDVMNFDLSRITIVTRMDLQKSHRADQLIDAGAQLLFSPSMDLADVLETIYSHGIRKLVVESSLVHRFISQSLFDKMVMIIVPLFATNTNAFTKVKPRLINVNYEVLGSDIVVTAEPEFEQPLC
jgi:riboflavin biosynthesis pyrimidine reductase